MQCPAALIIALALVGCAPARPKPPREVFHPRRYQLLEEHCEPCNASSQHERLLRQPLRDCGVANTDEEARHVLACALSANEAGEPFQAWFNNHCRIRHILCIDSWVAFGFVRTPDGVLRRYTYDSDGSGGNRTCSGGLSARVCHDLRAKQESIGTDLDCTYDQPEQREHVCSEWVTRSVKLHPARDGAGLTCDGRPNGDHHFCAEEPSTPPGPTAGMDLVCFHDPRWTKIDLECVDSSSAAKFFDLERVPPQAPTR